MRVGFGAVKQRQGLTLTSVRAVALGLLISLPAAAVWPLLLTEFGAPAASVAEVAFLAIYVWWVSGGGPPARLRTVRVGCFRRTHLSGREWGWGILAALTFAATVHAAIVLLFRLEPFPAQAFHRGYALTVIPSPFLQWVVCVVAALSAAVCEETGFRGYLQWPIESAGAPRLAVLMSAVFFTLVHVNKSWALLSMVPIVFGAGVLLGSLARASGTLLFGMLGHWIMDIGLFAYWWAQIAGTFSERPISKTGWDRAFTIECAVFIVVLTVLVTAILRLQRLAATADARLAREPAAR
jgi:membrane protease YdiL (CAAX protease family)